MLVSSLHESSQGRATRRRPIKPKPKGEKISKRTKRIQDQDIHEKLITSTKRQCVETRSASGERIDDLQQRAAEFARATLSKSLSLELAGRQAQEMTWVTRLITGSRDGCSRPLGVSNSQKKIMVNFRPLDSIH